MPNNLTLILILATIGLVLAIIAYYVVRFMKGAIKITMVRTGYNAGETIVGSFELYAKQPVEGNKLTVSLIGTQVTRTRQGGKTHTHSHEIYRNETVIEGPTHYPAEHRSTHEFKIATPNSQAPDFTNNPIFQGLAGAMRMLSNRQSYLKWRVEVRLDAKGVDLVASKKVTVNVGGLM